MKKLWLILLICFVGIFNCEIKEKEKEMGVISWTSRTSQFGADLIRNVAYGDGLLVAVGAAGKIATSPDGITWTSQSGVHGASLILNVAYGDGLFIAVGDDGKISTSPNGVDWTLQSGVHGTFDIYGIAYSSSLDLWVAVGQVGKISTSPNGVDWTLRTDVHGTSMILCVAWSPDEELFVAGGQGAKISTSPNGIDWTLRTDPLDANAPYGVCWYPNESLFVIAAQNGKIATSPNGIDWTLRASTHGADHIHDVVCNLAACATDLLIAVGAVAKTSSSSNGINWTIENPPGWAGTIYGATFHETENIFIIVGDGGRLSTSQAFAPPILAATADGVKFGDEAIADVLFQKASADGVKLGDEATVESFTLHAPDGLQLRLYSPTDELLAILSDTDKSGSILDAKIRVLKIGGVDKFSFRLDRNVDVPITRNTQCYFYVNTDLWFIGYVKETPSPDQSDPVLTIEGEGFVKRLLKKTITGGSYGPDTLENIIKSIANTELGDDVGVYYDVTKIEAPVVAAITIQFKDKNLFQIFTTLLEICNYDYDNAKYRFYVDNEKELVFELISEDLQNNLFEGYQFQQPEVSLDYSKIINKIFAFRTKVASEQEVEYLSTYDDLVSQGKVGLFVKKITFPDYANDDTIEKMCEFVLQRRADPQDKVEIEDYEISSLVPFGKYGISNRRDLYWKVAMACDTLDGWNVAHLDNTTLELSSTHVLTGRQSLKFTTAIGSVDEYAEYTMPGTLSVPLPRIARVFAYFENVACQIKITFYDEDGNQANIDLASIFTDQWLKYSKEIRGESEEVDLLVDKLADPDLDLWVDMSGDPNLDLWVTDEISPELFGVKTIRVTILENVVSVFYIDLFDIFANIYNYHELQIEELEYHLSSIGVLTNINFGEIQDSVIDEIKGQVREGNIALDIFSKQ